MAWENLDEDLAEEFGQLGVAHALAGMRVHRLALGPARVTYSPEEQKARNNACKARWKANNRERMLEIYREYNQSRNTKAKRLLHNPPKPRPAPKPKPKPKPRKPPQDRAEYMRQYQRNMRKTEAYKAARNEYDRARRAGRNPYGGRVYGPPTVGAERKRSSRERARN